jgi:hypothetical protein
MSPPERYLRLFDLSKYREIQPIVDQINEKNIYSGNIDFEKTISLIKMAMDIGEGDEIRRYNRGNPFASELRDGLEILQERRLEDWYLYGGEDKLNAIISLICCPGYQACTFNGATDSDTTVSYMECYPELYELSIRLYELLDYGGSETLPSDIADAGAVWILTRQELAELAPIVKQNLAVLYHSSPQIKNSRKGGDFVRLPEVQTELVNFYSKFDRVLETAISNPNYTIIKELFT